MHHNITLGVMSKSKKQADAFATYLLLPDAFEVKAQTIPTWELAEYYGVPKKFIVLRKMFLKERAQWAEEYARAQGKGG